jgi:predicted DNA-binding transcriptional regulator YafY
MPANKQSIGSRLPIVNQRLLIIDDILFKFGHVPCREKFLNLLNNRLKNKVSQSTFDKDIKHLRLQMKKDRLGATLLCDDNGYRYSEPGFKYFRNQVREEDRELLEVAYNAVHALVGNHWAEMFQKLAMRILTDSLTAEPTPFDDRIVLTTDIVPIQKTVCTDLLMHAVREKWALRMEYLDDSGNFMVLHVSPYMLHARHDGWFLVCTDTTQMEWGGQINLLEFSRIMNAVASNRTFRSDPDIIPMTNLRSFHNTRSAENRLVQMDYMSHPSLIDHCA